jgi:hypothetical protein
MVFLEKYISKFFGNQRIVKKRGMYAVTQGEYIGNFFVFIDDLPILGWYNTILLPDITEQQLSKKDVEDGIQKKILDLVDCLDKKTYNELIRQTSLKKQSILNQKEKEYNEYYNRRQQFTTQSLLGESKQ